MKCYEFNYKGLEIGMTLVKSRVVLGLSGRNSYTSALPLDTDNPAVVENDRMVDAVHRMVVPKREESPKFVVFQKPLRGSKDILLRVNTAADKAEKPINGGWRQNTGSCGIVFEKDGKKTGFFTDDIIVMKPDDSIFATIEGSSSEYQLANIDGKLSMFLSDGTEIPNGILGPQALEAVINN